MTGGLFPHREPTGNVWHDHGLSIVLLAMFASFTAYCLWSGAYVFGREQPFGPGASPWSGPFWVWWTWEYQLSLVADVFGVVLVVILTKFLRERGSEESK